MRALKVSHDNNEMPSVDGRNRHSVLLSSGHWITLEGGWVP